MLSILIPVYNYAISKLVRDLHREASLLNIPFEILVQEDASDQHSHENKIASNLPNVQYRFNNTNIGRTATRQALAKAAKYESLLFLDADVLPIKSDFIKTFLDYKDKANLLIGGIEINTSLPNDKYSLRWKFGRNREAKTVEERKKNPYLSISSACLFIKKDTFLKANNHTCNVYGMDVYFSYQLKKHGVPIKHINNPVCHLGLETNEVFLAKSLSAIDTLIFLENQEAFPENYTNIQRAYIRLKKFNMDGFALNILSKFTTTFEKNLKSSKPRLHYFDLYRLSYYLKQKHA